MIQIHVEGHFTLYPRYGIPMKCGINTKKCILGLSPSLKSYLVINVKIWRIYFGVYHPRGLLSNICDHICILCACTSSLFLSAALTPEDNLYKQLWMSERRRSTGSRRWVFVVGEEGGILVMGHLLASGQCWMKKIHNDVHLGPFRALMRSHCCVPECFSAQGHTPQNKRTLAKVQTWKMTDCVNAPHPDTQALHAHIS